MNISSYDWNRLRSLGFSEKTISAINEMTPNFLPEEPGSGDEKNPQMAEGGVPVRMPRMEVLKKANNKNGQLAMHATVNDPTYNEWDPTDSDEPNGAMSINQLEVMREKVAILLSILEPEDNLPPWCASKLAMSMQNLGSVCDFIRFGQET